MRTTSGPIDCWTRSIAASISACFVTAEGKYMSISGYRFADGLNKSSQ